MTFDLLTFGMSCSNLPLNFFSFLDSHLPSLSSLFPLWLPSLLPFRSPPLLWPPFSHFLLSLSLSGCPLADKSLRSLMAAHTPELKYVLPFTSAAAATYCAASNAVLLATQCC